MMDSEEKSYVSLISKTVFAICLTAVSCFWISSCQLDEKIIETCKKSCQSYGSYMRSVTVRECECSSQQSEPNDVWVLPNN